MMFNQLTPILLKRLLLIALTFILIHGAYGQFTSIQGVVNSYYQVVETIPSRSCVRVSNPAGLSSVRRVLIIQMKGATINTASTTSSTWGDTTSLGNAGNYELAYICGIVGDSVFLVQNLLNTYTASTGKVQLVTLAQYQNALVTDTLKAKTWDNTTGTGGVIALDIIDTLKLNAPVYADSSGFRGGAFFQHSGACDFFNQAGTAYAYDATSSNNLNGAYKGEGIADIASNVDGAKGAPANGGGGGNNHNNSGGGGGNLVTGGRGGGNSSSGPVGCNVANNMGLGGKALSSWNGRKVFAGGGGGAGHNNNAVFTLGGGNGGGIVFIHADTLICNGYTISANGGAGGRSQGDGAGGGGAGGTLIMDVNTFYGSANLSANGANGGNSDDVSTPNRCFGGGGGGAGGIIYLQGATPSGTINTLGGSGGIESNRDAGCATAVPGLSGSNGQVINNYAYKASAVYSAPCGIILPVHIMAFNANIDKSIVHLSWQVDLSSTAESFIVERLDAGGHWKAISSVRSIDQVNSYAAIDQDPLPGDNYYRLHILETNGETTYSNTRHVVNHSKYSFSVFPNPAHDLLTIRSWFPGKADYYLLDISGRTIEHWALTSMLFQVKLPALSPGIYIIRSGDLMQKIVIR